MFGTLTINKINSRKIYKVYKLYSLWRKSYLLNCIIYFVYRINQTETLAKIICSLHIHAEWFTELITTNCFIKISCRFRTERDSTYHNLCDKNKLHCHWARTHFAGDKTQPQPWAQRRKRGCSRGFNLIIIWHSLNPDLIVYKVSRWFIRGNFWTWVQEHLMTRDFLGCRSTGKWCLTWFSAWKTRSRSRKNFSRPWSGCGRTQGCRNASADPTSTSSTIPPNSESTTFESVIVISFEDIYFQFRLWKY